MKTVAKIIFLLSFVFYIFAPIYYSFVYCTVFFVLFIIDVYLCTKKDIESKFYFSFGILFSISFFLTTFAYPVFIKGIDSIYIFGISFANEKFITKSTGLAQLAYSLFSLTYTHTIYKAEKNISRVSYKNISKLPLKHVYNFLLLLSVLYFFYELIRLLQSSGSIINFDAGVATTFLVTITALISITYTYNNKKKYKNIFYFLKENMFLYFSFFIVVLSLLYIGDRGIIIILSLLIISTYQYYIKKIKLKIILPFFLVGMIFFFLIGNTRDTEYSIREKGITGIFENDKQQHIWDYFSDLTSISRNLYNGYEYTNTHGLLYPGKIFIIGVSPIPYLPTLLSQLFYNKQYGELSSGRVLTDYTADQMNVNLSGGLGTHCVSDVFMSWGILGIFIFYSFLGYLIGSSRKRLETSIFAAFIYFIFVSYALYIPRSTIYVSYDVIGKSIFLFLILYALTNKK